MKLKVNEEGYIEGPLYNKDLILRRNQASRVFDPTWPPPEGHVYVAIREYHTHDAARVVSNKETFDERRELDRFYILSVKVLNQGGIAEEITT